MKNEALKFHFSLHVILAVALGATAGLLFADEPSRPESWYAAKAAEQLACRACHAQDSGEQERHGKPLSRGAAGFFR